MHRLHTTTCGYQSSKTEFHCIVVYDSVATEGRPFFEMMLLGDNLKHYSTVLYIPCIQFIFYFVCIECCIIEDKLKLCNIMSIALSPKVVYNICYVAQ
jgi:hypothetical protein